ncbi:phosphotransferase [Paenibacillus algorifonticola]|uniref:phosphotransferase n=1 Tax=Paenibacillus algorifonticola TaxID=684063 RepID=UPI003D2B0500
MLQANHIQDIIEALIEKEILDSATKAANKMNGTTDGLVFMLAVHDEPKYVLKQDNAESLAVVEHFHQRYVDNTLLPTLLYTDPAKTFIVYTYTPGTTHYNRGSKSHWMSLLVTELLNAYTLWQPNSLDEHGEKWGRIGMLRDSWQAFNERSFEGARYDLRELLPLEDHQKVESLLAPISIVDKKYLLHGDTGVHNLVFHNAALVGVIDPSPMIGPIMYDFTYAFCSSPDDLNLETLFAAYEWLNHKPMDKTRVIQEVIFQLYCRIAICSRIHPHDWDDYMKAWTYWRKLLP